MSIFSEDPDEVHDIFSSNFIDLSWMEDEENFYIRGETIEYLKKEIKVNPDIRNILRNMTDMMLGKKPKFGKFKYLYNEKLLTEIEKAVKNNSNLLFHLFGKTGSGKSLLGQKIGFLFVDAYIQYATEHPDHPRSELYKNSKVELVFTVEDANRSIQNMYSGSILIRDEQSKTSGEGSSIEDANNNNLRKTVRGDNINFIDCQPDPVVSNLLNFVILSIGYHKKYKCTLAIVYVPMPGTKMDTTRLQPVGFLWMKKHDNLDFEKWYIEQKMNYINNLKDAAGQENVSLKKELIIEDGQALIQYARDNPDGLGMPDTNGEWQVAYAFANIPVRNSYHPPRVINYVKMVLRTQEILDKKTDSTIVLADPVKPDMKIDDPMLSFSFDVKKALEKYDGDQRDVSIYLESRLYDPDDGLPNTVIAKQQSPRISPQRVGQILKRIEAFLDWHMGHQFEQFAKEVYEQQGYEVLTEGLAHKGDPDLIVKKDDVTEIISLKCTRTMKEISQKDLEPEINAYRNTMDKSKVKLYLEFINTLANIHKKIELDDKNLAFLKTINLY